MARAKKKEDKNTLYYAALYSKHSELYEMAYEDSKKVVNSGQYQAASQGM